MEDMLYEIESVRRFCKLKITGPIPDETTILKFRHFLEKHKLGNKMFDEINKHLESQGLILKEGTIVDASIISAPTSTKNQQGERDPEMHQTKKGNEWHLGMKMHIGADADTGLIHSLTTTAASIHDITQAGHLLHGEEGHFWGDAGYQGIEKRPEHRDRDIDYHVAMRPGKRRQLEAASDAEHAEKEKASIRAKVEHPFHYVKGIFGYAKVRYRGLMKNTQRLYVLLSFTNLMIAERYA